MKPPAMFASAAIGLGIRRAAVPGSDFRHRKRGALGRRRRPFCKYRRKI